MRLPSSLLTESSFPPLQLGSSRALPIISSGEEGSYYDLKNIANDLFAESTDWCKEEEHHNDNDRDHPHRFYPLHQGPEGIGSNGVESSGAVKWRKRNHVEDEYRRVSDCEDIEAFEDETVDIWHDESD